MKSFIPKYIYQFTNKLIFKGSFYRKRLSKIMENNLIWWEEGREGQHWLNNIDWIKIEIKVSSV